MFASGQFVVQLMERFAPRRLAVEGDRIGLQVGTLQKEIRKALVALDVTDAVVDEAIAAGVDLIIAHHAVIYRPLPAIDTSTPAGRIYEKLIKNDIAVYVAHTNLDTAEGGMNDWMADALGIESEGCLEEVHVDPLLKLVVYVPETHRRQVQEAVWRAGAGQIGEYDCCSFEVEGTGTFRPGEGTNPHIGTTGKLERVKEIRIETILPESLKGAVVQAMLKAHPYEEPAYDLFPLKLQGKASGLGRFGRLKEPATLEAFARHVKEAFDVPFVRVVGDPDRVVRRAAVLGGSGSRYMRHALRAGADVFVTGDIDYHTAHDALAAGLAIVDPGHNAEKIMKAKTAERLAKDLAAAGYLTEVIPSALPTEPFRLM
ncbi:MAG: Nif3-like dinuclear metal center hexameric protein [Paenibacillaceae bacterium]|nr:MAG: Nif3-like dinuclear metal center hexameric protein [Paenibacillaceae bacterium]